jgi:hypothetical protein
MVVARRSPAARRMARCAIVAERCKNVVRIGRTLEYTAVAGITVRRRTDIPAAVARDTRSTRMFAGQRKAGSGMIEGRRQPTIRAVA